MILGSTFQAKLCRYSLVRDKLIYIEYGVLTKNGGPGAIAPEAFEKIYNSTMI